MTHIHFRAFFVMTIQFAARLLIFAYVLIVLFGPLTVLDYLSGYLAPNNVMMLTAVMTTLLVYK